MKNDPSFLGRGWTFPPQFSQGGGTLDMVADVEDITQSLEILFATPLGSRIMQEDFGSSLMDFQFEEMSPSILQRLRSSIEEAVLYHEARIKVNEVKIDVDQERVGLLYITLDFTVPSSNSRYNMVYPFYLAEANI